MFCTKCGNSLETGDNFCGQCGNPARIVKVPKIVKPQVKIEQPVVQEPDVDTQTSYNPPVKPLGNKTAEAKEEKKREEHRAELKKLLEEKEGREVTDQELFEAEHWLRSYAEIVLDSYLEDERRKKKLEESPKGFHLEGEGYSCFICGGSVSKEQTWYDKYGIKCLTCQSAIDKKIIPASAAKDKDSWYSMYDLEHGFFINRFGIKKLIKEDLLKPRTIPGAGGGVHCQLFFIKDHEGILPPKELTKWPTVKVQKDGEDWYTSEPWFMHGDIKEVLKGYKILDYCGVLEEKHIVKSFPQLSHQIPKGARSIMTIDHIESKDIDQKD